MKIRHILRAQQFNKDVLFSIFKDADELRKEINSKLLNGKIMAVLFYEPSTRTRLSFESAMLRLGGKVIGTENAKEFSSAAKGESIEDTIRVISKYADCVVMRHPIEGTVKIASEVSSIPIINGGDGKGQHPTQALLDMYTIHKELGRLDNLKVAIVGDLKNGRTARSLCYLLSKFEENKIIFVSPDELKMQQDIKDHLNENKISFREEQDLNKILPEVDIVYMTRIQKERISIEDYDKSKGKYSINEENISLLKDSARIMHPLPHVEEINLKIKTEEGNPKVAYFRQAENGLYIRMALLKMLLCKSS